MSGKVVLSFERDSGNPPTILQTGWSEQYGCAAVVIPTLAADPDAVMELAEEIDAVYDDGEDRCYVIDFRADDRQVGPELYTERCLRASLRS
jgi:hypothetical protein